MNLAPAILVYKHLNYGNVVVIVAEYVARGRQRCPFDLVEGTHMASNIGSVALAMALHPY